MHDGKDESHSDTELLPGDDTFLPSFLAEADGFGAHVAGDEREDVSVGI